MVLGSGFRAILLLKDFKGKSARELPSKIHSLGR